MADEVVHPFLPEQEYGDPEVISTYDFIYFIQDYTPFLRNYLDYLYDERYITADDHGYYNSFIDICNEINTDEGDDGTFETYREQVEPFMEWMTEECGHMNVYYEDELHNDHTAIDQKQVASEAGPTSVASRTRSKRPASAFEIPPAKKGTNMISLEPTNQEGVRIKLSDGKEYTHDEIKDMWRFSKEQTPLRHPYTEEDKQKIKELLEFAKGGKKTRKNKRKSKKTRKVRKNKSKKVRKNKRTKTRQ
jgi:hypothetical protein